jgi:opine dehydrogenase
MKVAVLGSGAGGTAVAFDWAAHGHDVYLFDFEQFPDNIAAIAEAGCIECEGDLEGSAPVAWAGHDVETAVQEAELVFVVAPSFATRAFADATVQYLSEGQMVVICPGSCGGALAFKHEAALEVGDDRIVVAETSTLPYAVRLTAPSRIRVFLKLKGGVFLAAVPARLTEPVLETFRGVYPGTEPGRNVMQTSLQNANPVIHPAVSLLNAGLIERTGGAFLFYEEGVTDSVGRLIEAVDKERIAIGEALDIEVIPDPELGLVQGYMTEASYGSGYRKAPGFQGIKAQPSLDHRYLHEDVGYGLVFMADLGRQLGVATPVMDAVITVAGRVMGRDYRAEERRTMESLRLAGLGPKELEAALA